MRMSIVSLVALLFRLLLTMSVLSRSWSWLSSGPVGRAAASFFHVSKSRPRLSCAVRMMSTTTWTYNQLPKDFIVIEDRVLMNLNATSHSVEGVEAAEEAVPASLLDSHIEDLETVSNGQLPEACLVFTTALTKDERRQIHQYIRKVYGDVESMVPSEGMQEASAVETAGTNILIFNRKANKNSNLRNRMPSKRWGQSYDYLHFTAVKEDMTTRDLIQRLARRTGYNEDRFAYCGNKDKRAITLQRISLWRGTRNNLDRMNSIGSSPSRGGKVAVRDVAEAHEPMRLGSLAGNLFVVTLRSSADSANNFTTVDHFKSLLKDMEDYSRQHFINYFGHQRFGNPLAVNPIVGKFLLRRKFRSAVMTILMAPATDVELQLGGLHMDSLISFLEIMNDHDIKANEGIDLHLAEKKALMFWQKYIFNVEQAISNGDRDSAKVEKVLNRLYYIEKVLRMLCGEQGVELEAVPRSFSYSTIAIVERIMELYQQQNSNEPIKYFQIFEAIPESQIILLINSYQSYIWNLIASQEFTNSIANPKELYAREGDLVLISSSNKKGVSSEDLLNSIDGVNLNADWIAIDDPELVDPYFGTRSNKFEVHKVTTEEAASKSYSLLSVVIPTPGFSTVQPKYVEELLEANYGKNFVRDCKVYAKNGLKFPGAYRHLFSQCSNFHFLKLQYNNQTPVTINEFKELPKDDTVFERLIKESWKQQHLPKLVSGFLDSPSLKIDDSIDQSLLVNESIIAIDEDEEGIEECNENSDQQSVIRLSFGLGSSSYATVYLQQLLDRCNAKLKNL